MAAAVPPQLPIEEGVFELDPRYRLHSSRDFELGSIFKVLWSEPSGELSRAATAPLGVRNQYTKFNVGFRRFLVIGNDEGNCVCAPILTYGGQGCRKRGVRPAKHGIIHEIGTKARLLKGEPELGFSPVQARITAMGERLAPGSRVNYSKFVTVEHKVKVFFLGYVVYKDFDIVRDASNTCWANKIHEASRSRWSLLPSISANREGPAIVEEEYDWAGENFPPKPLYDVGEKQEEGFVRVAEGIADMEGGAAEKLHDTGNDEAVSDPEGNSDESHRRTPRATNTASPGGVPVLPPMHAASGPERDWQGGVFERDDTDAPGLLRASSVESPASEVVAAAPPDGEHTLPEKAVDETVRSSKWEGLTRPPISQANYLEPGRASEIINFDEPPEASSIAEAYDIETVRTYEPSVFSAETDSTSLGMSAHENPEAASARTLLVGIFVDDPELGALFRTAAFSSHIGQQGLRRSFRHMLRDFSVDLRRAATSPEHERAASFVGSQAAAVATLVARAYDAHSQLFDLGRESSLIEAISKAAIVEEYLKGVRSAVDRRPRMQQEEGSDVVDEASIGDADCSSDDENSGPDATSGHGSRFDMIEEFLTGGEAFRRLKDRLRCFVYPPAPTHSIVNHGATVFSETLRLSASELGSDIALTTRLKAIIHELQYAQPDRIYVTKNSPTSWADQWKVGIERKSGLEWDWWPWSAPDLPLRKHESRISWTCRCGQTRREVLPAAAATNLSRLYLELGLRALEQRLEQEADAEPGEGQPMELAEVSHRALPGSYSTSPYVRHHLSTGSMSTEGAQSSLDNDPLSSPATDYNDKIALETEELRIISVLINGTRFLLAEFDGQKMTTQSFFQSLNMRYAQHRGFLRRWLSIHVFGTCNYTQLLRYGKDSYSPGNGSHIPPASERRNYHFVFDPSSEMNSLLTEHMFHDLFYGCDGENLIHRVFHQIWRCQSRHDVPYLLDQIPQRKFPLQQPTTASVVFWGLRTRERVSAWRVFIYVVLGSIPSLCFPFLWFFYWEHPADIQGAAVPAALTLGVVAIIMGAMATGDEKKQKQS